MRHIYLFIMALCTSVAWATNDTLSGKFTVNEQGKQVQFAKGNLQYVPSTDTWQFAVSQTESVGRDTTYLQTYPDYTGAVDLFLWGEDYGEHIGKRWRMLTNAEWEYLLREETPGDGYGPMNAGQATIVTQHGLMLVPDGWQPFATLTFESSPNNWTTNSYSIANWDALEQSGVVFLPCVDGTGSYWAATPNGENNAYGIHFYETAIQANSSSPRGNTLSVRLVKDVSEEPTGIEPTPNPSLKGGEKVLRNGQLLIVRDGTTYTVLGNRYDSLSRQSRDSLDPILSR